MGTKILDNIAGGIYNAGKFIAVGRGPRYAQNGKVTMGGIGGLINQLDPAKEIYMAQTIVEGAATITGGVLKGISRHVPAHEASTIIGSITGRELRPTAAIAGLAILGGASVGDATFKIENKLSRGQNIGTINLPGDMSKHDAFDTSELEEKGDGRLFNIGNNTINNYGATGDIVFALNNMR